MLSARCALALVADVDHRFSRPALKLAFAPYVTVRYTYNRRHVVVAAWAWLNAILISPPLSTAHEAVNHISVSACIQSCVERSRILPRWVVLLSHSTSVVLLVVGHCLAAVVERCER